MRRVVSRAENGDAMKRRYPCVQPNVASHPSTDAQHERVTMWMPIGAGYLVGVAPKAYV